MMRNKRLLISYLTAAASATAAMVTILTFRHTSNDVTQYMIIASMMSLMFGYSVIMIVWKPTSRRYDSVLAKLHIVIHEIRTLMTSDKVDRDQLHSTLNRILIVVRDLFDSLSNSTCRASLLLLNSESLTRYAVDERSEIISSKLLNVSAFSAILDGDKCFIGDISEEESPQRYLLQSQKLYRSLAVFPISKTETPLLNVKKRIIVGFLVLDSLIPRAFSGGTESLAENIFYRTGSIFADSLALLIPLLAGKETDNANN